MYQHLEVPTCLGMETMLLLEKKAELSPRMAMRKLMPKMTRSSVVFGRTIMKKMKLAMNRMW